MVEIPVTSLTGGKIVIIVGVRYNIYRSHFPVSNSCSELQTPTDRQQSVTTVLNVKSLAEGANHFLFFSFFLKKKTLVVHLKHALSAQ